MWAKYSRFLPHKPAACSNVILGWLALARKKHKVLSECYSFSALKAECEFSKENFFKAARRDVIDAPEILQANHYRVLSCPLTTDTLSHTQSIVLISFSSEKTAHWGSDYPPLCKQGHKDVSWKVLSHYPCLKIWALNSEEDNRQHWVSMKLSRGGKCVLSSL